jgi:hypothetical protein
MRSTARTIPGITAPIQPDSCPIVICYGQVKIAIPVKVQAGNEGDTSPALLTCEDIALKHTVPEIGLGSLDPLARLGSQSQHNQQVKHLSPPLVGRQRHRLVNAAAHEISKGSPGPAERRSRGNRGWVKSAHDARGQAQQNADQHQYHSQFSLISLRQFYRRNLFRQAQPEAIVDKGE